MSIFSTDPQYKWVAAFILIVAGLAVWANPEYWMYILAFVGVIFLISFIFRNNQ